MDGLASAFAPHSRLVYAAERRFRVGDHEGVDADPAGA